MREPGWMRGGADVAVERLAPASIAVVRIRGADSTAIARVSAVIGTALPQNYNASADWAGGRLCWLCETEWMVAGEGLDHARVAAAIAPATGHVAQVGEGRARFRLAGPRAAELLEQGTGLNVRRTLAPGRCAQTLFAQTLVLLDRPSADPFFVMTADISFADHLQCWFETAIGESLRGDIIA